MKQAILYSASICIFLLGASFTRHYAKNENVSITTTAKSIDGIHGKRKIQVALLMDTSSSMDGLIEQAKSQLWRIVNELATAEYEGEKPTIEIALYHYGNDGLTSASNYIEQILPFTTDLDKVSEELFNLTTNGGSEYCGAALKDATDNLTWSASNEDLKLVYIAGNEPFSQGPVKYETACRDAIKRGIIINTIYCGDEASGKTSGWLDGAQLADGEFMTINMNEQTVYIETPFDSTLMRLNSELNSTYIFYGSGGVEAEENQIAQDDNAKGYSGANFSDRVASKSSSAYYNSSWDLVDKSKEKNFDIKKIEKKDLPESMKNMNEDEKLKYIADQNDRRDAIKKEIADINLKRQEYIDVEQAKLGETNSLDKAIINSVKKVALEKNYTFE